MATAVRISGWRPGLRKVSITQAIMRESGLGLRESKSCADRVLEGECVVVPVSDAHRARGLARELESLGAKAEVVDDHA